MLYIENNLLHIYYNLRTTDNYWVFKGIYIYIFFILAYTILK